MNIWKRRQRLQTYEDYQVEGCIPVYATCGQVAGFQDACTELLSRRRREYTCVTFMMNNAEHGNTVTSPCAIHGKPTVRQAHEGTVVRSWKKQRPFCNGVDRISTKVQSKCNGCLSIIAETTADVQQVFHCERIWRIFSGGNANDSL